METILQSLPNLRIRQKVRDDDSIDQLHHFVTVYLFAFAGFLIGLKEFVGEPLDCWVNLSNWQHFQGHVNSYCWGHRMYKFPNHTNLGETPYPLTNGLAGPANTSMEDVDDINFYRWVTIVFFVQAFLFKLPALIWSECNEYSGTQIEKMVSMINDTTFELKAKRQEANKILAEYLETWLKINRKPFWFMKTRIGPHARQILRYCMVCVGGNTSNYLSTMYLIVKFLFLLNVFIQFALLTAFLDFNFWHYGPYAISASTSGNRNIHFPRVGLCHFQLLEKGQWVQCILSINMLLEKIFLIEWFWLLVLLIITAINFIVWIMRVLQTHLSVRFITKYLRILLEDERLPQTVERNVDLFLTNYLGNDGVFVLRIIATNTNDVAMAELICSIWTRYLQYENRVTNHSTNNRERDTDSLQGAPVDLEMDALEAKAVL